MVWPGSVVREGRRAGGIWEWSGWGGEGMRGGVGDVNSDESFHRCGNYPILNPSGLTPKT